LDVDEKSTYETTSHQRNADQQQPPSANRIYQEPGDERSEEEPLGVAFATLVTALSRPSSGVTRETHCEQNSRDKTGSVAAETSLEEQSTRIVDDTVDTTCEPRPDEYSA
jgi:hypothetical protein